MSRPVHTFRVVRIDNGLSNPHTGIVCTQPTHAAASAYITRANRTLRSQPGMASVRHPYAIQTLMSIMAGGRPVQQWHYVPEVF